MEQLLYEFAGTAVILLLGNGVVANVVLPKTNGHNGGLMAITVGWAMAVFCGVFISAAKSGAHLNPAVTLALAIAGKFSWNLVAGYMAAQLAGAFTGSLLVWLAYKKHYDACDDAASIRGTFCTAPAIANRFWNMVTEATGTFVLAFGVLYFTAPAASLGTLDALPVALLVLGIGLGLGGPTGYAINPARDLGPRIAHALLPLRHKSNSNWNYAAVPVVGPFIGGTLAALAYMAMQQI